MLYLLQMHSYYYSFTHGHHTCTDRARTRTHVHGHWPVRATDSTDIGLCVPRTHGRATDMPRTFPVAPMPTHIHTWKTNASWLCACMCGVSEYPCHGERVDNTGLLLENLERGFKKDEQAMQFRASRICRRRGTELR